VFFHFIFVLIGRDNVVFLPRIRFFLFQPKQEVKPFSLTISLSFTGLRGSLAVNYLPIWIFPPTTVYANLWRLTDDDDDITAHLGKRQSRRAWKVSMLSFQPFHFLSVASAIKGLECVFLPSDNARRYSFPFRRELKPSFAKFLLVRSHGEFSYLVIFFCLSFDAMTL